MVCVNQARNFARELKSGTQLNLRADISALHQYGGLHNLGDGLDLCKKIQLPHVMQHS